MPAFAWAGAWCGCVVCRGLGAGVFGWRVCVWLRAFAFFLMDLGSSRSWLPTCVRCGEVIGVYELAVMVRDGAVCDSSHAVRVAQKHDRDVKHFHRACFGA